MRPCLSVAVVIITTTSIVLAIEYDLDGIMDAARREINEELKQSTINGASSRRFARKKFTAL